eukprot:6173983-Pleurochrysis_carterae.AAC.1
MPVFPRPAPSSRDRRCLRLLSRPSLRCLTLAHWLPTEQKPGRPLFPEYLPRRHSANPTFPGVVRALPRARPNPQSHPRPVPSLLPPPSPLPAPRRPRPLAAPLARLIAACRDRPSLRLRTRPRHGRRTRHALHPRSSQQRAQRTAARANARRSARRSATPMLHRLSDSGRRMPHPPHTRRASRRRALPLVLRRALCARVQLSGWYLFRMGLSDPLHQKPKPHHR